MLVLPLVLAIQAIPHISDHLPPANALSPGEDAPSAVLAPLQAIIAATTPAAVLANTLPDGAATIVTEGPAGPAIRRLAWADFAVLADAHVQERLTDPAVEIDGDVATIWSPYVATRDAGPVRCGVEQASLVRQAGSWRVLTLVRSDRRADHPDGC